jgi:hypothetical protein
MGHGGNKQKIQLRVVCVPEETRPGDLPYIEELFCLSRLSQYEA